MHDCNSPYIVSFYGAYLQDTHICMCMEYMDKGSVCLCKGRLHTLPCIEPTCVLIRNNICSSGRSLDNIYKSSGPVAEDVLGKIAFAVVSGLTYLYDVHRIMHRGGTDL